MQPHSPAWSGGISGESVPRCKAFATAAARQGPKFLIVPTRALSRMAVYASSDFVSRELERFGTFEQDLIWRMEAFMRPGTVLLDVGANLGWWSFYFASKNATVHSFEPFHDNLALQNVTKCLNPAIAARIYTYPFGLYYEQPASALLSTSC